MALGALESRVGGAWLRVAEVPRSPEETWDHSGSREEKKNTPFLDL